MKLFFSFFLCSVWSMCLCQGRTYEIDLRSARTNAEPVAIDMRGTNPHGETITVNNKYFIKNGRPWFPLMGEMHYNRVPSNDWEEGIQKMKSAGLSIVATYVFWNEHETGKDEWDWKNNRDLRHFIELCGKNNMYVWLRIGPWSHGEQLHGGYPEWIQKMKGHRTNDPLYIAEAAKLFKQIGTQASGLFFEEGGPIIGTQLENEYASGQAAHISKLKTMALEANIHPVFWSVTANTVFDDSKMEVLPLQGAYCYRGWEKGGGTATNDFLYGDDQWIMTGALGKVYYDVSKFPRGLCEQGSGSQMTFRNRFVVEPHVLEAHLQNQIGRGMNLVGYYMFHGGTQTPGLKEPGYPESYDFQSPIGEFGIIRASFNYLKILHSFINDFGEALAQMQPVEPANPIRDISNTKDLRYIVRTNNNSGFLFLCNTQVRTIMPDRQIEMAIKLTNETVRFPSIMLKGQSTLILPFNLKANNVLIKYVTAQPLSKLVNGTATTLFFVKADDINPEISIDLSTIQSYATKGWTVKKDKEQITCNGASDQPIYLTNKNGHELRIVFLTRKEAAQSWRTTINGKQALIISKAEVIVSNNMVQLRQFSDPTFEFKVYPKGLIAAGTKDFAGFKSNLFDYYKTAVSRYKVKATPKYVDKSEASITLPHSLPKNVSNMIIKIKYSGSSCTVSQNDLLLTDNLYNGTSWMVGTKNYLNKGRLQFKIQDWKDNITGVEDNLVNEIKVKGSVFDTIEAFPEYSLSIKI